MKYFLLAACFCLLLFSSCKKETVFSSDDKNLTVTAPGAVYNVNASLILQLVNNVRKSGCNCGSTIMPPVAPVTWNDLLSKAAYDHSLDMQSKNYFDHTGLNGSNPGTRISAAGYSWRAYGENIAKGYPSETEVVNGWINSEGHCKNIMNANFKEMGAGRAGAYWTQEFGTRLN
jgi:uncharacterized protein YkwD